MMKSLLTIGVYLTGASGVCALCLTPSEARLVPSSASAVHAVPDTTVRRFAIQGMTCGSCAVTARIAIQRSSGVYKAEVSYDEAKATVWYDSVQTSPSQIIAVLEKATGYEARELK